MNPKAPAPVGGRLGIERWISRSKVDLAGKVAIVTGGASGIGRATVQVLAEAGAGGVVVADIDRTGGPETVALVESSTAAAGLFVETDVAREEQVEGLVAAAVERFGQVDILVNNAGICPTTPWDETTLENWNQVLAVNLTGAYLCTRAVLPHMRARQFGRIVYISSAGAVLGSVTAQAGYGASKAGMIALMKYVARNFAADGILANAIAPGSIDTPITNSFGPEVKRNFAKISFLDRQGTPRELADAVLFLVSERATYVTGATFHINGGFVLV